MARARRHRCTPERRSQNTIWRLRQWAVARSLAGSRNRDSKAALTKCSLWAPSTNRWLDRRAASPTRIPGGASVTSARRPLRPAARGPAPGRPVRSAGRRRSWRGCGSSASWRLPRSPKALRQSPASCRRPAAVAAAPALRPASARKSRRRPQGRATVLGVGGTMVIDPPIAGADSATTLINLRR